MRGLTLLLTMGLTAPLCAQVIGKQLQEQPGANWLHYNGSYDSRRATTLDQVNTQTVSNLTPAWVFHVPGAGNLQCVPIVVDGVMYVTQPNAVYALDAASGRSIWEFHHTGPTADRGANRGVAVYGDKVFFSTPDAVLIALSAATGNELWEKKLAEPEEGYWSPAAPLIVKGKVIVGVAPGDRGLNGFLDAYDAETGKRLWRWDSIPKPGVAGNETWAGDSWKHAGGNTWLTQSYDPELNLLYWGIGNPSPDFNGDMRPGDNLFTESVVALNPDDGTIRWHFQFTPHDVMDWDAVELPVLVDASFQGKPRKLMLHADRNGFYYVLDRTNGEFLHGSPFVQHLNWASGLTPEGRPIRVPGVTPSLLGTKVCPSSIGATNWMSPTFNQQTGLFYVVALEGCGTASISTETFRPGGFQYRATGDVLLRDASWKVYVRALDMATGKVVWENERVGSIGLGGGLLSAGGLVFSGELNGQFIAYDAKTGKTMWHFNTGQSINSQPMSYAVEGKQYIGLSTGADIFSFGLFEPQKPLDLRTVPVAKAGKP